jgi:hypothetical protein
MTHGLSAAAVRVATLALPAGSVRERYRREFLADLHVFEGRARLAFALGILLDAFALRAAVGGDVAPVESREFALVRKPLLCRLHLHFRVRCINEEGDVYHRCRRCGDDQYEFALVRGDRTNVAANIIGGGFTAGW